MNGAVLETQSSHTDAFVVFHDEIESKVFDEKVRIVAQRLVNLRRVNKIVFKI